MVSRWVMVVLPLVVLHYADEVIVLIMSLSLC